MYAWLIPVTSITLLIIINFANSLLVWVSILWNVKECFEFERALYRSISIGLNQSVSNLVLPKYEQGDNYSIMFGDSKSCWSLSRFFQKRIFIIHFTISVYGSHKYVATLAWLKAQLSLFQFPDANHGSEQIQQFMYLKH